MKNTGILLHISSLPGEYGIGDFGPQAYKFADYLASNGHSLWQILPLNHCGYGNSPYNPLSAFALNPYLVSPELLYQQGYISLADLREARLPATDSVCFELVAKTKDRLLARASDAWLLENDLEDFLSRKGAELKPYLTFLALTKLYSDSSWPQWNSQHRQYNEDLFQKLFRTSNTPMRQWAVTQAILHEQITLFRQHLHKLGISLIGDLPLYLAYESADVWAQQHLFDLDEQGRRLHLAGVPPDAFASGGQLWGNPLYRWQDIQEEGFSLFLRRIGSALQYYDILRLDHFIGYVNYWQVDCRYDDRGEPLEPVDAMQGRWVDAVPEAFFEVLLSRFARERFLAEDLGILNERVCQIRDGFGFPGMIVLQFCFEESVPDVHHYPADRWLYTSTHDNATLRGWFESLAENSSSFQNLKEYCRQNKLRDCYSCLNAENIHLIMRQIAMSSPCQKVILPMQDILGLDNRARMNIPGTALGNWQWRMQSD